ncbi:MAG: helix-turn-helix domain-containing protein [Chitinophagaceae bacterium]|nr:helix-turn-helix domain-containing protein [Chitinophagaceae bacterium]
MRPLLIDVKSLLTDSIHIKEIDGIALEEQLHFHNVYEIALIITSGGKRIVGDNIEDFTDGDLVLLGPNVPHMTYYGTEVAYENDSYSRIKALVIYFNPDWLSENHLNSPNLAKFRKLIEDAKRGIKILGNTRKKVIKEMIKLKNLTGLKRIISILFILEQISISEEYQCLAREGYLNTYSQQDVKRIDEVYAYVMSHFTEKISLPEIASVVSLTPTAFCKYFKSKTQKTFSAFVNEVRIGHACKLLGNKNLSISQVCYRSGFNNLASFNKNFRSLTKMIPSEYRLKLNNLASA